MELTEDQIIEKNWKIFRYCKRKTLPPYEYEFSCLSCEFNKTKKHELSKFQRKKNKFHKSIKICRTNFFCIFVDVYKIYEGNDYDKIYEVLLTLENKI